MTDVASGAGLFHSARQVLAGVLEMAQIRLELLGTEFEMEKRRLLTGLLWGALALLALLLGLMLACALVILLFWDGYRLVATGVLCGVFLLVGLVMLRQSRDSLCANGLQPFEASLAELRQDAAGLRGG